MTWITNKQDWLKKTYNVEPKVIENTKVRYKKYCNRAVFNLRDESADRYYRYDPEKSSKLHKALTPLGNSIRMRHEWIYMHVYFNDLVELMDAIPSKLYNDLVSIELMSDEHADAILNYKHDYPVRLTVANKLPYDCYRYRVYVASSSKVRKKIGASNLAHIYNAITAYDGIKFTPSFAYTKNTEWCWTNTYFYAKDLDWLPMITLMEPTYIRQIEEIKTKKEVENESSANHSN